MFGNIYRLLLKLILVAKYTSTILKNFIQLQICFMKKPEILCRLGKRLNKISDQQLADGFILQLQRCFGTKQHFLIGGISYLMNSQVRQIFKLRNVNHAGKSSKIPRNGNLPAPEKSY